MKTKLSIVFGLLTFASFGQSASTFVPKVNNIPTSPEAAMLGRFGDIPVGYYTGTANISIPLYTIVESGVEIPITLNYHSSGIKVADEATWVGLGWSLEPGGSILQEVRGKEDTYDQLTWGNSTGIAGSEYNTFKAHLQGIGFRTFQTGSCLKVGCQMQIDCTPTADAQSILNNLLEGYGEPDIFNYSFPGYSGKYFIHHEKGEICLIDKRLKLKIDNNAITTQEGNTFSFHASEVTHGGDIMNISGRTSKLTNITLYNGRSIGFSYNSENYSTTLLRSSVVLNPYEDNGVNTPQTFTSMTFGNKQRLTQIETADALIIFNAESRHDMAINSNNNVQRLKSIDIKSKVTGKKIKSFLFSYSYFNDSSDYHSKRLRLDSVKEIGYDLNETPDNSKPPYVFEYDTTVILPAKESLAVDFWGYFNGQHSNNILIPDLRYFENEHDDLYAYLGNQTFSYSYTGANRYTDNTKVGAYMLKKIIYPTKGYTEFEFEPHSFTNQYIPNLASLTTASKVIVRSANNAYSDYAQNFYLSRSTTLHFHNTFSHGSPKNPDNSLNTSLIGNIYNNARIKLTKLSGGVTTIIKEWQLSDSDLNMTLPQFITAGYKTWDQDVWIEYEPGMQYTLSVSYPTFTYNYQIPNSAQAYSNLKYYDDTEADRAVSSQGGLRIKSIKSYTAPGILASYKKINYYDGKLLNRFEPLESIDAMYNKMIGTCNIGFVVNTLFRKRISISSDDFGNNSVGYGRVEEVELAADGIDNIGKKTFYYINQQNQNWKGMPTNPFLRNGLIQKEEVYSKLSLKLKEIIYNYITLSTDYYYGIKIQNHVFGNDDYRGTGPSPSPLDMPLFDHKFSYALYPVNAEWTVLSSLQTIEYLNGLTLNSTQNFTFNTNGTSKTVATVFANGEEESVKYYYADDHPTGAAFEYDMITANVTALPIVTENYKGTELVTKISNWYIKLFGNVMPLHIYSKKGLATEERRVTYDSFDFIGNILQCTLEGGIPVSYIWGYNRTLPIARIENAHNAQIATALGITVDVLKTTYSEANITAINNLRSLLPNAMITTYTYKPLVGVSTITDPKNYTINYHYDNFGRLIKVTDMAGKIVSENQYNYKP